MSKPRSVSKKNQQPDQAASVMYELGKLVAAIQDPSEVLRQISEEARKVLGANIVDLYEYNQVRKKFTLPPIMAGERWHPHVPKNKIYDDDVVVKVVNFGKPQYFSDAQSDLLLTEEFKVTRDDAPDERFVIREGVISSCSLPLRTGEETVGVMFVNYRTRQSFDKEQIFLIDSFSNLAATAIRNARMWGLRDARINSLKDIIDVIGTKEAPLDEILKQTVALFSANNGSIGRLMENGRSFQHKVRWVEGKTEVNINEPPLPITQGITGHVIRSGRPFRTGDVSTVPFYDPWYKTTKSEMAFPLRNVFDGIIGVLNLESDYADFFTGEDEELCKSFAHAASAAIQQSDLIEDIQSFHNLTESHTLKELLDRILNNLNKMMGERTATSINLYDSTNDEFYAYYGVGPGDKIREKYLLAAPRKEGGTARYVLETREFLFYDDVNNIREGLPKIRPESKTFNVASFAVLPLIYQGEMVGALFVNKLEEKIDFTDDIQRILKTYADQAAIAIHNAQRLVNVEPLKAILNATVSDDRNTVLKLAVEQAVGIMGSDYASVWLGDHATGDLVREAIYIKPEEKENLLPGSERLIGDQPSVNMMVYKNKKAMIINDVAKEEKAKRYTRIYTKAKSELVVPLIFRDEIIGTLNTESQYPGAFSEFDKTTLGIFADIVTAAIKAVQNREENDREIQKRTGEIYHMNYRLERRNASFEALTEVGQQLTANVRYGERQILSIIHQQASRIMDTNNMYIALYEPEKDEVHFELAFLDGTPVDIKTAQGWGPRSGGQGRTEWIIRHRTPILTYTKADAEEWYKRPDAHEYIGEAFASWLGVPIMFGDEVLGVIATYHKTEEYKYDPDDVRILSLMGRQAAIALQNARLINKLDTVRELGEDLSSSLSA